MRFTTVFGRKTPEQPSDNFSLSHISNQDEIIASFRARQKSNPQAELAELEAASLANLSPEERARKENFSKAMREMITAKDDGVRKDSQPTSYYYRERPEYRYGRSIFPTPKAALGAIAVFGVAGFFGPGLVSDAMYGEEKAAQYLEESGYTDIEPTDKSLVLVNWQGCGEDDAVKYSFEATGLNGADADVIVCKGIFKGATIRD